MRKNANIFEWSNGFENFLPIAILDKPLDLFILVKFQGDRMFPHEIAKDGRRALTV